MDELPAHAKAVLRRARGFDDCQDDDARRRIREGVARAVGVSAAGASVYELASIAAQPAAPAAKSASVMGLLGKLTATAVVVVLAGSSIALLRRREVAPSERGDTRASAVLSAPANVEATSLAGGTFSTREGERARGRTMAQEVPANGPALRPRAHESRRSRAGLHDAHAPAKQTLDAEVVLLRRLEQAVSRRDTREASRLLAQHRARFAEPLLLEERQGFSALVGCMEQQPAGLAEARTFVARYPRSVLTARVLRECGADRP